MLGILYLSPHHSQEVLVNFESRFSHPSLGDVGIVSF